MLDRAAIYFAVAAFTIFRLANGEARLQARSASLHHLDHGEARMQARQRDAA